MIVDRFCYERKYRKKARGAIGPWSGIDTTLVLPKLVVSNLKKLDKLVNHVEFKLQKPLFHLSTAYASGVAAF